MATPAPTTKTPFDAYRVCCRPDGTLRAGVSVTKVQVHHLYPRSRLALIRCGSRLGVEATVPFRELHSTVAAATKAVADLIPVIDYQRRPAPIKPRA